MAETATAITQDLHTLPSVVQVEKVLAERTLRHFTRQSWHLIEPAKGEVNPSTGLMEPIWNWHLDAVCEHLQACVEGEIRNLLVNIPPRHTKSILTAVNLVPWAWVKRPYLRVIYSSYAEKLSIRDSLRGRRIIQSSWYKIRWGHRFQLTSDQNEKLRWENDRTGYRVATSVGGLGTGEGGDGIIVDDPHNVLAGESEAKRQSTLLWWDEAMSTRLDDPSSGFRVIIMQRVHENDLSGHVLEKGTYEHLCLPARYEAPPTMVLVDGSLAPMVNGRKVPEDYGPRSTRFEDPRTEDGELLNPKRYGEQELKELELELGEYAAAGQLQQRPEPRGGGMIEVENLKIVDSLPSPVSAVVRYWDKAGTQGGGAATAGVKMARLEDGTYVVLDVRRGHWKASVREQHIKQTAESDGPSVVVWVEQEPGSGGKESAENTVKNLAGFVCRVDKVTGSKEVRADPFSSQVNIGNVVLLRGAWNNEYLSEARKFPVGKYKDQIDASSGAFNKLPSSNTGFVWGTKRARG